MNPTIEFGTTNFCPAFHGAEVAHMHDRAPGAACGVAIASLSAAFAKAAS